MQFLSITLLAAAALVSAHGPCKPEENGNYGCTDNVLWQCDGSEWVILQDCGSTGERVCKFDVNLGEGVGCFPSTPVASPTSAPVVTAPPATATSAPAPEVTSAPAPEVTSAPAPVATSAPAPPVVPETCSAAENGEYKCSGNEQLWICNGSNWVLNNDCGALGYICISEGSIAESIGCAPPPPAGHEACPAEMFGQYQCVGQSLQICAYDPWWTQIAQCAEDQTCVSSGDFVGCLPNAVAV
ncbi:hypothetical protein HDU98_010868 [Podochytrium sp. JEL0797]|nr:hypothetical protein HDU98_010868 [Podochytrium sp. JEL0797]